MLLAAVVLAFCCTPFGLLAASQVGDVEAVPLLGVNGRQAYTKFLSSEPARAFAISPTGGWGYTFKKDSRTKAVWSALYNCNKASRNVCRVYALNDDLEYQRYVDFEQQSIAMIEKLKGKVLSSSEYGDELRDYRVVSPENLLPEPYHEDTPLSLKNVHTIKTVDLLKLMASAEPPILIDTLEGDGHRTLPGAYWVRGAGMASAEHANADIRDRLDFLLSGLTKGNKAASIVFFCLDSRCRLSYNASLRARDIGYSNISWYRGGIKAWEAASLDTLVAIQYGQMR